jgi:hypothetical protein
LSRGSGWPSVAARAGVAYLLRVSQSNPLLNNASPAQQVPLFIAHSSNNDDGTVPTQQASAYANARITRWSGLITGLQLFSPATHGGAVQAAEVCNKPNQAPYPFDRFTSKFGCATQENLDAIFQATIQ